MKDNFDDILKKKWEQIHFPVDDNHRKEMITLLDSQKRRRNGLLWWWTGLGGAVVAIALLLVLQQNSQSQKATLPSQRGTHSGKQETVAAIPNSQPEKTSIDDVAKTNINAEAPSVSPAISANSTSATLPSSKTSASSSTSSTVSSSPSAARNQTATKTESKEQNETQEKKKVTGKTFADGGKRKNTSDTKALQENVASGNNISETKEITSDRKENVDEPIEPLVIVERKNDIISFLPSLEMQYLEYNTNDDITTEAIITKKRPIRLFAEAGAGLVFGSKPDYSSGWTFNIGGGLDHALNEKTHFTFSGGYLLQNGGFDFERSSTVNQLSFGARSSFHTLTPKKLHFVYAKVGLHHHFHRHIISVLGGVQYLYGAQGDITLQVVDDFEGTSTETDQNVWLKLDGMQQYLINAEVKYGYQITPKLSLHTGIRYYFTGIEANDPELVQRGFYWNGKYSRVTPFFTLNYQLYGTR